MLYLDHNATTPLDPRVLEAMLPWLTERFANPASPHAPGCAARSAVERAREQVAAVLGADPREIVFTSGATEANNLALLGMAESPTLRGRTIVTVATEHRAVLEPCERLARRGFRIVRLGVDAGGHLELAALEAALDGDTGLVSVMTANNETGVLHPLPAIARLCEARGIPLHTDATQSFGKEPLTVSPGVALLSASAHKFHGPKGVGFLYVRRKPRVRLLPRQIGGGHERGLRAGTLPVPLIVGMGTAAALCDAAERERLRALRDRLEAGLLALGGVERNGAGPRLAHTSNLSFAGVAATRLMEAMPELAVSTAAACTSAAAQPSYVLGAMGCDDERIRGSLRFSLGRGTTAAEIATAVEVVTRAVRACRSAGMV